MEAQIPTKLTLKKLLETALQKFSQSGYDGVSVRDIANASSVTKPTLYYYFENKEGLYRQVAMQAVDELMKLVASYGEMGETAAARSLNLLRRFQILCRTHQHLVRFVVGLQSPGQKKIDGIDNESFINAMKKLIEKICSFGVECGELVEYERQPAEFLLLSAYQSHIRRLMEEEAGNVIPGDDAERAIQFIFAH